MNQNLAQGGSSAPSAAIEPSGANALADALNAAFASHQAGAFTEAERLYRHVLSFRNDHADLRSRLGAVLMAQGKTLEAVSELERAVVLQPDLFEAHSNLAQAYSAAGRIEMALETAIRAFELRDTPPGRTLLARCLGLVRITADDGRVRRLALRALVEGWARPRDLTGVCISIIKLNTTVTDGIAKAGASWPARLPATELIDSSALHALAKDDLLCRLMEHDPITDIGLERLLTNVRSAVLTLAASTEDVGERFLEFYCSLARQCFINEYVYATTESETAQAQQLRHSLEKALTSGDPFPVLWPVALAAYFPLHSLSNAESLLQRPSPPCVQAVITQQIEEPAQEHSVAGRVPALTPIEPTSARGDRRVEESVSTRWVIAATAQQPLVRAMSAPPKAMNVLIAGCGSGLSAVELARRANNARVLAVDRNLACLSYGIRMAENLNLTNLEFAQADVTKCGALGRQFDLIDVSGVLDHLADPWAGWQTLLGLLRPGGRMQVGIYSAAGHRKIAAARALMNERDYQPHSSDIRHCREELVASADPLARSVTQWEDFFTTSECRYMLFGVHEQPMTLHAIKSFLAKNDAQFSGFFLDTAARNRFAARFADPAAINDLEAWAKFEAEEPDVFPVTYQFWVDKPAELAGRNPT
jgi:ubiquinone/menaquinone biosynthesis C-methylase UbiE/tetratricopeptide (TPR) repeat protein